MVADTNAGVHDAMMQFVKLEQNKEQHREIIALRYRGTVHCQIFHAA